MEEGERRSFCRTSSFFARATLGPLFVTTGFDMNIFLSLYEARVIGCLLEKEIATPEQYPLSMNALVNACNQKSNRDPVLALDEATVQGVVDGLVKRYFVNEVSSFGSRVAKYQHRFCNTEYGQLKFSARELAVMAELFLRGPQTPGELRSRAGRLCPDDAFTDVTEVDAVLKALSQRDDGPFVVRLPREPGKRESRYAHTMSEDSPQEDAAEGAYAEVESPRGTAPAGLDVSALLARLDALEAEVVSLKERLAILES